MILIRADQQRGAKAVKTVFGSVLRGFFQTQPIAIGASMIKIGINAANKLPQVIVIRKIQRQINRFCIIDQGIAPGFIFGERMNVWIIPKTVWLNSLVSQRLNTRNRTGGATDMQQQTHKKLSFQNPRASFTRMTLIFPAGRQTLVIT